MAQQVNHFENTGVKRAKYGEPSKARLAKEVQDVLRCGLRVVSYYGIEQELEASIEKPYRGLQAEGFIDPDQGRAEPQW